MEDTSFSVPPSHKRKGQQLPTSLPPPKKGGKKSGPRVEVEYEYEEEEPQQTGKQRVSSRR